MAAAWVFAGSAALIIANRVVPLDGENVDSKLDFAKEVFTMVLPIATGIVTYWFASRKPIEGSTSQQGIAQQRQSTE
ncbi:MAG: hypothetical protein OXD40_13010 [bacterium]|nr:hypothetical protein [bacterium]